jgi:hypothetical protein
MNQHGQEAIGTGTALSRPWAALLAAVVVGALAGAAYAALVGSVHLAIQGRWNWVPVFAAQSITAGAGLGLAVGAGLALAALTRHREPPRSDSPQWQFGTCKSTSLTIVPMVRKAHPYCHYPNTLNKTQSAVNRAPRVNSSLCAPICRSPSSKPLPSGA